MSISVSQKGVVTNIDFEDDILKDRIVPKDILKMIYIGRCNSDNVKCGSPGGMFTDLNIWSKELGKEEMEKWTACK